MTRVSSSVHNPSTDTRPSVATSNRPSPATGRAASPPPGGGRLDTLRTLGRQGRIGSTNTPPRAATPQLTREASFNAWLPTRCASSRNSNAEANAKAQAQAQANAKPAAKQDDDDWVAMLDPIFRQAPQAAAPRPAQSNKTAGADDDWAAMLDPIFRQAPKAAASPSERDKKTAGLPQYSLIDAPKIPSRDRLDDFVQRHNQLAVGLRRAIGKAQQVAQSGSPVSWKTAFMATFTKSGKRDMANKLSAKRDELKSLHGELSRLLTGSEVKNATRSEIAWEKKDPQRKAKALEADRAMAETQRWRPTAQNYLRNIGEHLQALELELAKLPKPTR